MTRAFVSALAVTLGVAIPSLAATRPEWLSFSAAPEAALASLPGDSFTLSPEREQTLRERGDSHVDLLIRVELQIGRAGERIQRSIVVRRYLTPEGVREWGNQELGVRPAYEEVSIETAAVIQPTGQREFVDPDTIQITDSHSGELFSDAKDVVVPFPHLQPGSTAVIVLTRSLHASRWPLPWSQLYAVRGLGTIERFEVAIDWLPGVEAPRWSTNDARVLCAQSAERSVACASYAIAPFRIDPDMGNWADLQTYVAVSQDHTWADLVAIERDVVWEQVDAIPLAAIGEIAGSPIERLEQVYRFVADEVRYVAVESGTRSVVPRRASETLALRYGDCKDKVTLFLALARAAGLDAYPVLVASRRYDPERLVVPSWQWFDHMIACARGLGPEPICLELTTPHAGVGELPTDLHGAVALPLAEVDERARPTSLGVPHRSWSVVASVRNRIDCDGNIDEEVSLRFVGSAALALRSALRPMNPGDRLRWAEETYEDAMGKTPKPEFRFEGLDTPGTDVTLSSRNRFPRVSTPAEATQIAEPDAWLQYLANGFNTANRHNPYRLVGARVQSNLRYELCNAVVVRHSGARLDFRSEIGSLTRTYEHRASMAEVSTTLDLIPHVVLAKDLDHFRHFLDRSLHASPVWLGLETAP
jgi:transglutaminase-like putative cysteine protease